MEQAFTDEDFSRVASLDAATDPEPRSRLLQLERTASELKRTVPASQTHAAWVAYYSRLVEEKIVEFSAAASLRRPATWQSGCFCCCRGRRESF